MTRLTFAAAALALGLTAGAASAEKVRIGMAPEPYPPFASVDASGNWTGWEIDLMWALWQIGRTGMRDYPHRLGRADPGA